MNAENNTLRIGITTGDLNGIGLEVVLKALEDPRMLQPHIVILYGSVKSASFYKKGMEGNAIQMHSIADAAQGQEKRLNVINCWEEEVDIKPGEISSSGAKYAYISLESAVKDLASNKIDVLITAPINKKTIQAQGFNFPGHTEYLAKYANVKEALMLMVFQDLRVGVVTGHIPLKEVSSAISQDRILHKIESMSKSLQGDFGIRKPKIAVLGLNPHAGDNGAIGSEDQEIISPAIQLAKEKGILAFGPYPADGFFGSSAYKNFDGILAMYHDQGLIPFKALSAGDGVNFTAGLPIVRTSPAHGTAFEIAGKNTASENSMRNAFFLACDVYLHRRELKELQADPLKISPIKRGRGDD